MEPRRPEDVFDGYPEALAAFRTVQALVGSIGPADVVVSKTQVAFRRRRGFAYVWAPGRWLRTPSAGAVLSIALTRCVESPRFKQVARPTRAIWMHHLEIRTPDDLDDEVRSWLAEAWADAE